MGGGGNGGGNGERSGERSRERSGERSSRFSGTSSRGNLLSSIFGEPSFNGAETGGGATGGGANVDALSGKSGLSSVTEWSTRKIPTLRSLLQLAPPASQMDLWAVGEGWEGSDGELSESNDKLFDLFDTYYPRRLHCAE